MRLIIVLAMVTHALAGQSGSTIAFNNGTKSEAVLTILVPTKDGSCTPPNFAAGGSNRALKPGDGYSHPSAAGQRVCWLWSDRVVSWKPTQWCAARPGDAFVLGSAAAAKCRSTKPAAE
jgi:hypothetical protein